MLMGLSYSDIGFSTEMMLLFLVLGGLVLTGNCIEVRFFSEVAIGEEATIAKYDFGAGDRTWSMTSKGITLCKFEGPETVLNINPEKYACSTILDGTLKNFTIKALQQEDAGVYPWQDANGNFEFDSEGLYVYAPDNSDLINKVVDYGNYSMFAYHFEMKNGSSVQWSFLQQPDYNGSVESDIYYGNQDGGGKLPNALDTFRRSVRGFGVSVESMTFSETGRYQYLVVDTTDVQEKAYDVAVTRNFRCQPSEYLIIANEHTHSCSAEVSYGDIIPEFTWFKDGEIVEGYVSASPQGDYILYTYTNIFEAGWDDIGANYSCVMKFKYTGTESEIRDSSDPVYTDSCGLTYAALEYAVRDPSISSNITDGLVRVGERLSCWANGTSPIDYTWSCGNDTFVVGQSIEITEFFFFGGYTNCECYAENRLSDGSRYGVSTSVQFSVVHQSYVHVPPPAYIFAFVGDQVQLDCTLAPYVVPPTTETFHYQWTANFYDDKDFMKRLLYTASDYKYGVVDSWREDFVAGETRHDLIMRSARFGLEGLYRCEAMRYPDVYSFNVEVYFTDRVKCVTPQRKIKRGENVELDCMIEHSGSIEPEMIWYADDNAVSVQGSAQTVKKEFSSIAEVGVSLEAREGVSYKCKVSLRSGSTAFNDECTAVLEFDNEVDEVEQDKAKVSKIIEQNL